MKQYEHISPDILGSLEKGTQITRLVRCLRYILFIVKDGLKRLNLSCFYDATSLRFAQAI